MPLVHTSGKINNPCNSYTIFMVISWDGDFIQLQVFKNGLRVNTKVVLGYCELYGLSLDTKGFWKTQSHGMAEGVCHPTVLALTSDLLTHKTCIPWTNELEAKKKSTFSYFKFLPHCLQQGAGGQPGERSGEYGLRIVQELGEASTRGILY
ncbi:unnamed protein product [Lepeophtheirus salmonis]|uniref:(salmon louse) hypothetical protein n=1 Tax=Lepeophtheirus salmonis TaxID=72036 RepID=A0A7R8CMA7_LEPSM|nr:unnamed protein product [Lepeophtheirus salmonis]CAF2862955.1 unnamed protein product [Lepeophtheirus salmonis]